MCILHLGENRMKKYIMVKKWEQFKSVLLFMVHPVLSALSIYFVGKYLLEKNNTIHDL